MCYSNIKQAFKAYKLPPIANSDHIAVQLVPTYVTKHKKMKRKKIKKRQLDDEALEKCKAVFETTDWQQFVNDDDVNQTVSTISDYVNYVIASHTSVKEFYTNSNQRPWINSSIKSLMASKQKAKTKEQAKQIQAEIRRHIDEAKAAYKDKMMAKMSSDIRSAWKGIKNMAGMGSNTGSNSGFDYLSDCEQTELANDLNKFFVRFDDDALRGNYPNLPDDFDFDVITTEEVIKYFKCCKIGKASGPDGICNRILKYCAHDFAPVFTDIFNFCLRKGILPDNWKLSSITPLPKKPNPQSNNDYRPIALTSVIMKCFERIMKARILKHVKLEENQFAYRCKRSTKDACISLDHFVRSHLEKPNSYARILFVDYSSAFNTIVPSILVSKLKEMNVPVYIQYFVAAFLSNRQQYVRIGKNHSNLLSCGVGCPQGCVISPILFSIYTDFLQTNNDKIRLLKYADDMALVGLLNYGNQDDPSEYFNHIQTFVEQCKSNNLVINPSKTKEMVLSFSRSYFPCDYVFINGNLIERVDNFKYLGTFFNDNLKWSSNTDNVYSKLRQRFFAFSKFKHFKPNSAQRVNFIETLILPVLTYNIELWFYSATQAERDKLLKNFFRNGYVFDCNSLVDEKIFSTASNIIESDNHILNECYQSNRKFYRLPKIRCTRFSTSFIPKSINILNGKGGKLK